MKYVAWVYKDHKYKNILLSSIRESIDKVVDLFIRDRSKVEYILRKRLIRVLELSVDTICKYSKVDLSRIDTFVEHIDESVLDRCILERLTVHNIVDINRYIMEGDLSCEWGPGNHTDSDTNLLEHYKKHVLSEEEGLLWKTLCPNPTLEWYREYASLKECERIVVHSNGKSVYISGFRGNVFVVGRYHNGALGISSCYIVESGEKEGRYKDRCIK